MKATERIGAPAVGNAIGLFIALYFIDKYDWLPTAEREYIVAACGTICIHLLFEARQFLGWLSGLWNKKEE